MFQVSPERGVPPPSSPGGSAMHYFEGRLPCKEQSVIWGFYYYLKKIENKKAFDPLLCLQEFL